jgi:hypothetical protein
MKPAQTPDASVLAAWRLLRIRAQALESELAYARKEREARQGAKTHVTVLAQAHMAARRTLRALTSSVPLP